MQRYTRCLQAQPDRPCIEPFELSLSLTRGAQHHKLRQLLRFQPYFSSYYCCCCNRCCCYCCCCSFRPQQQHTSRAEAFAGVCLPYGYRNDCAPPSLFSSYQPSSITRTRRTFRCTDVRCHAQMTRQDIKHEQVLHEKELDRTANAMSYHVMTTVEFRRRQDKAVNHATTGAEAARQWRKRRTNIAHLATYPTRKKPKENSRTKRRRTRTQALRVLRTKKV